MGIKKMFKKKEPTEQELVQEMQKVGISTKGGHARPEKFGAFRQYAQDQSARKPGLAPVNPYANMGQTQGNPYAANGAETSASSASNPYSAPNSSSSPYSSPYSTNAKDGGSTNGSSRSNPYASQSQAPSRSPYSSTSAQSSTNAHSSTNAYSSAAPTTNPYGAARSRSGVTDPYARKSTPGGYAPLNGRSDELTLDLNAIPTEQPPVQLRRPVKRGGDTETLDLNAVSDEEDLNVGDDFLPGEEQPNSEDEEVEAIKQDIRFVKQESLQLTRNTLQHAMQADALGTNTLGVLGSQSERLYNAEQDLLLGETQTQIADEKVKELHRLNRSIFIPATGNPFNKKLRLHQQEARLKTQKEQEKYLRETNRQGMYASEQRVKQGLTSNATSSDTYSKYQGEKHLQQAQRYQFENDSEDDEIEKELASNLDQISSYTKKLKGTATLMGQEVDAQNKRLRKIEEDADRLDINVHLNSTRLSNIR